jgi:very-short-patch-repair endonuclease
VFSAPAIVVVSKFADCVQELRIRAQRADYDTTNAFLLEASRQTKHTFMMFHVILTRDDLSKAGKSPWQIERALRRGEIERAARGTFVLPRVPEDERWLLDLSVLLHRCSDFTAASHRSAARLHEFDGDWDEWCEVLAPLTAGVREPGVYRTKTLLPEHRVRVQGISTTTMARTLVDLGRFLSADAVELALESALRGDPRNPHVWNQELLRTLEAWPSVPRIIGHGVLREVLTRRVSGAIPTASAAETLMVQILRRIGLDRMVLRQPKVEVLASEGRRISGYPDFLFWQIGLAIEVDGKPWHSGEFQRAKDNRRENVLGAGLRILRYTGSQIRSDPYGVAREIAMEHRELSLRGLPVTVSVVQLTALHFRFTVGSR